MSDPLRLARAALADDDDALSPLCRSIVNGEHGSVKPKRDDERVQLLAEIDALRERISKLETGTKRKPPRRKMEKADMEMFASAIGNVLGEAIEPVMQRIEKLEAQSSGVKWAGVWHDGMRCNEGELITDKGSLWLCTSASTDRPGDNVSAFRLVAKNGSHDSNGARRHVQTAIRK